jgi:hypothetical protein
MARVRQASAAQRRRAASLRRDGALDRLSSITGSIAVAILAAVAALGIYVAKALPGHHAGSNTGATNSTVPAGNSGSGTGAGAGASSSPNSINPPSTPPTAASAPPPVTSGST